MANKALLFNGVSDYVGIPSLPYFTNTQPHSYETWAYLNSAPSAHAWLINNGDAHNGSSLVVSGASRLASFFYHGGDYVVQSDLGVPLSGWHHLVVTFSGTEVKFYLDAVLIGTKNTVVTWSGGSGCGTLGVWKRVSDPLAFFLDGGQDEPRIYNKALSQAEVTVRYNANAGWYGILPDPGLVAGFHLDDDALDYSGNGHTGTVYGATYIAGKVIQPVPIPNPPSDLIATAISPSEIDLAWTSNSGGSETGFKIERKTGIGGTYAQIDTVGVGIVSYHSVGLSPNTTYYYRVRAYNGSGDSDYCTEAYAITPELPDYQTYYLSSVPAPDSTWGTKFNNKIIPTTEAPSSLYIPIGGWLIASGVGLVDAGSPGLAHWPTGDWTVKVNRLSGSYPYADIQVKIVRTRADGYGLEETSLSAPLNAPNGVHTIAFPGVSWTAGSADDRLAIVYQFSNDVSPDPINLTIELGTVNTEIVTPFPASVGWSHKWMGIHPSKIMGIPIANVVKFMGLA